MRSFDYAQKTPTRTLGAGVVAFSELSTAVLVVLGVGAVMYYALESVECSSETEAQACLPRIANARCLSCDDR